MLSRFIKYTAGIFAGSGLIVLVIAIVLSYAIRTEQFRLGVESFINNRIPGSISFDSVDFFLAKGAVEVSNFSLRDPAQKRIITAKRLEVNISLLSLLRKTVHIDNALLDTSDIFLETDQYDNLNLIQAFTSEPSEETEDEEPFELPVELSFGKVQISNVNLNYRNITEKGIPDEIIHVENIGITASSGNINNRSGLLKLELGPCSFALDFMNSSMKKLVVETRLDKGVLTPFKLDLDSDMGRCSLNGKIENIWENPKFDLDVDLDVDLAEIDRVFDVDCELKGRVTGGGTFSGRWDNPDIDAKLYCKGGYVLGYEIGDIDLDTKLSDRTFDIRRLLVKATYGTGAITGFVYFKEAYEDGFFTSDFIEREFAYDLTSDITVNRPELINGMPENILGIIKTRLEFKGKGFYPESMETSAVVSSTASDFRFLDGQHGDNYFLNTSLYMYHSDLTLKQCDIRTSGVSVSADGKYNTKTDSFQSDIHVLSDDLSKPQVLKPFGSFAGNISARSSLKGNINTVSGVISGNGKGLSWDGLEFGDFRMESTLEPSGILNVSLMTVEHPRGKILASGDFGVLDGRQAMDLDISLIDIEPAHFLKDERFKGVFDGRLLLKGTAYNPSAELVTGARKLAWDTWTIGNIRAEAGYDKGLVTVHNLELSNGESKVLLKGTSLIFNPETGDVFDDPLCDLVVSSEKFRIEDFFADIKGHASFDGELKGPASRPFGKLKAEGNSFDFIRQTVGSIKTTVNFEGEDIVIESLVADVRDGERIEVTGKVSPYSETYDVELKCNGISIESLDFLEGQKDVTGIIEAAFSGKGHFDDPFLKGGIKVSGIKLKNERIEDALIDVLLDRKKLFLSGRAVADIKASLNIETFDFSGDVDFNNLDLKPFFSMADLSEFNGSTTGHVSVSGNLEKVDEIKANAVVTSISAGKGDVQIATSNGIVAAYENRTLSVKDSKFQLFDSGYITAGGKGTADGNLDFYLKGSIPMSVARFFNDDMGSVGGDVTLDGRISGTVEKPDIRATLKARDVSFLITELMQNLHGLNGDIEINTNKISVKKLEGKLDSGSFRINGSLLLDDFKPGELSLVMTGDALPVSVPDMLDVTFNSRITVKGTPEASVVEGNILILNGKYYKNISLDLINTVKTTSRSEPVQKADFTEPYLKNMAFNISLTHRNPFEIDNNVAFLPLKPNLKILGTLNNPLVSGRAEVDTAESFISYQGNVFDVTRGRVDFLNPYKIEPTLDVQCRTEIRDWAIYLLISGTPDNLNFSLTSDPAEEDADILSLLVLGKTTEELFEGSGDKTQSAAKLLADILSSSLEKNIKDATGIDTVEVEYVTGNNSSNNKESGTGDSSENGVKVTLGKELSERLTLKYGVETRGGMTIHHAVSEYRFFENMLMNAYQDTENKYGAELVYRIEFR